MYQSRGQEFGNNPEFFGTRSSAIDYDFRQTSAATGRQADARAQLEPAAPPGPGLAEADVPADATTPVNLAIGGSYDGELEVLGDRDWIRVELTAGTYYRFSLDGSGASPTSDVYLRLYDADGIQLAYNDDGGPGLNSLLGFIASSTGTYYLSAGAYQDGYAGTYTLAANAFEDLAGDVSTLGEATVNAIFDVISDTTTDHDWYRIDLLAGQSYSIASAYAGSSSIPNYNSTVTLFDAAGNAIDSTPLNLGSGELVEFTASYSGTYYIDLGAGGTAGESQFSVSDTIDDIAGSILETTALTTVGTPLSSSIDYIGDNDIIEINLEPDQLYTITLNSESSSLYGYINENGNTISSVTTNYETNFAVHSGGSYYLQILGNGVIADYELTINAAGDLGIYTTQEVADYLTTESWGLDSPLSWDASIGDILTVNITGLTTGEMTAARTALALWSDVSGLDFQEVDTGGDITFNHDYAGSIASTALEWDVNNHITSATVSIYEFLSNADPSEVYTYWLQTYVREIGHAIGLGSAGNYDRYANFATDAIYLNDSWQTSIMSDFSPYYSPWVRSVADFERALTPQIADILAVQGIYGIPTTTRTGNTTYGFNSTAGRDVFDATLFDEYYVPSVTIFDSHGIDTLDFSGFDSDQAIDLAAGGISSVGGMTGNLLIALSTTIERAIGGSGDDTLTGNAVGNVLTGNGGDDRLSGLGGNDFLTGGDGDDMLLGGDGLDLLDGGAGADSLYGDAGNDRLFGRAGNDMLDGGAGDDILIGDVGDDEMWGQDGADRIRGGNDNDALHGGNDDDVLYGQNGDDTLWGDAGNDFLQGGANDDTLYGGDGNDRLGGGGGDDQLFGGDGNDIATGNGGNDSFTGGAGNDRFDGGGGQADSAAFSANYANYQLTYYAASGQVRVVDLRDGSPDGTDTLFGTEELIFANGVVTVSGGAFTFAANAPVLTELGIHDVKDALGDLGGLVSLTNVFARPHALLVMTDGEDMTGAGLDLAWQASIPHVPAVLFDDAATWANLSDEPVAGSTSDALQSMAMPSATPEMEAPFTDADPGPAIFEPLFDTAEGW